MIAATFVFCFFLVIATAAGERCVCYNEICSYLNGVRVQDSKAIYLILDGRKCHVPDIDTYNKLFKDANGVLIADKGNPWIADIPVGPAISKDAYLGRYDPNGKIYFINHGEKRYITSPSVFDKYYFKPGSWVSLSEDQYYNIPSGRDLV